MGKEALSVISGTKEAVSVSNGTKSGLPGIQKDKGDFGIGLFGTSTFGLVTGRRAIDKDSLSANSFTKEAIGGVIT